MWQLEGWQWAFVAFVMGAGAILLGYSDLRRLLHLALDDRYGQWARFCVQVSRLTSLRKRLTYGISYSLVFFFCYGLHDLALWLTLLGFDLFVLLALLSPFWRCVFFEDWSPTLGVGMVMAGVSVYMGLKLRRGLDLCRVHGWSPETWRCERCGEYHAQAEEQARRKKAGKPAVRTAPVELRERGSWRGFWEKRLERLAQRLAAELPDAGSKTGPEESPRPAG